MDSPAAAAHPPAELVVLNGRLKGSRRALLGPLTLLGQDDACDIILHLDGIAPFHVALVTSPAGPILRDLVQDGSVLLNNHEVDNRLLHDGDVLVVGPFEFQVAVAVPCAALDEGLRIQVAAVAAEQMRLTELEGQLDRKRTEQETQERQLAAHLEEKHARLEALQHQVKAERDQWRAQRQTEEEQLATLRMQLAVEREQFDATLRQSKRELLAREESLANADRRLGIEIEALERQRAELVQERAAIERMRLHFNTEAELTKGRLHEERESLALAQQQWEVCLHEEEQHRSRQTRELDERTAELTAWRADLAAERVQWRREIAALKKEAAGLEARIQNQRARLTSRAPELPGGPTLFVPEASPVTAPLAPAELRDLIATLDDQRQHLAEQWVRLAQQQERWEADRAVVVRDLEGTSSRLADRELAVQARELAVTSAEEAIARMQAVLDDRLTWLAGFESRLRVQALDLDVERGRFAAEAALRDQIAVEQVAQAEAALLHERARARRAVRRLGLVRREFATLHGHYAELWRHQQEARRGVVLAQQEITRRRLGLEKFRQDTLTRVPNAAAAERRLERLDVELRGHWAREEADLKVEWQALDREREQLNNLAAGALARLAAGATALRRCEAARTRRAARRAERDRHLAAESARWQRLEAERRIAEQRADALQAELDQVARTLLGESEPTPEMVAVESRAA